MLWLLSVFLPVCISLSLKSLRIMRHNSFGHCFRRFGVSTTVDIGRVVSVEGLAGVTTIGMPKVIAPSNADEDWLLWYHFRDENFSSEIVKLSTGRIAFAKSKDGLSNWVYAPDSPVMGPNKESGDWFYFDSEHVGLGDVIQPGRNAQMKFTDQGNVFLMYIFGGNGDRSVVNTVDGVERSVVGSKMEIGVAVSRDGEHWSRIEGPAPHGSIIEAGNPSSSSTFAFDSMFVGWPCVIEVGSEYRMYYHTYDPLRRRFVVGLAVASDGLMKWRKLGPVFAGAPDGVGGEELDALFDAAGASRRHVLAMTDGSYKMYYEGVSKSGSHSIGLAESADGVNWQRTSNEPVFSCSSDPLAWDSGGVGSPHLVWLPSTRRWRLYYVGYRNKSSSGSNPLENNGIGVAESVDEAGTAFQRLVIEQPTSTTSTTNSAGG